MKLDDKRKLYSITRCGENNTFYGKKHTDESKLKNRLSNLGKPGANKGKFGELNPNWKGGISSENLLIRSGLVWWRKFIFKRDDYTCQICGEKGGSLRANHIKKFSLYPELRDKTNNGITICKRCDYKWVFFKEQDWESYFNFNLETRGIV